MRRVVVTGMGIVSCLGNERAAVGAALRESRSGVSASAVFRDLGLRSHVAAIPDLSAEPAIERRMRRFMGTAAMYAHHAMRKAMADARLTARDVADPRVGVVVGAGSGSLELFLAAVERLRRDGVQKVPPYAVPQSMASSVSASLATAFGVLGRSYSITSACSTAAHCIGHAMELIRFGKQDIVFAGGADEASWPAAALFDAMGALSTGHNDRPQAASRPYDAARDGFVIGSGSGMLALEDLDHARARGAPVYAELAGYGASSDGADMIVPTAGGAARAMRLALEEAGVNRVDYINAHGTSTPAGDIVELEAIREVFGESPPPISSTKGLTGHAIAASGAHEAIYSLLMMNEGFLAPCTNLERPDPAAAGYPLVTRLVEREVESVLSNSLGFGGTNASLLFRKCVIGDR